MIDFEEYYTVVRKHVPICVGVPSNDIPARIYARSTVTLDQFPYEKTGAITNLEFDGEIFWRVSLSQNPSPMGDKLIAYVLGGIRLRAISFPRGPHVPEKIVNSILNRQYREHVIDVNARQLG